MRQYGSKTNFMVTVDSEVKLIFTQKFSGQCSFLIESFMRDMIRAQIVEDTTQKAQEDLLKMYEEKAAEKNKINVQLQALDLQIKDMEAKKKEAIEKELENKKILEKINAEEDLFKTYLEESGDLPYFELARKMNPQLTHKEYYIEKQNKERGNK